MRTTTAILPESFHPANPHRCWGGATSRSYAARQQLNLWAGRSGQVRSRARVATANPGTPVPRPSADLVRAIGSLTRALSEFVILGNRAGRSSKVYQRHWPYGSCHALKRRMVQ